MNTPAFYAILMLVFSLCGLSTLSAQTPTPNEWYGDSANRLIYLRQGWSAKDREAFYSTTQGSQLMPYAYYVALEQADNARLFNEPANILKFRGLPREKSDQNPDGLPVGFVADKDTQIKHVFIQDRRSIGFTCAACHTAQINYKGTAIRIDGGPTLADMDGLINALLSSMEATLGNDAKFQRFAGRVLKNEPDPGANLNRLRSSLAAAVKEGQHYVNNNHSALKYGFGRLDAFGRIFNRALDIIQSPKRLSPNAPVSFPFLWDTPKADCVQWTGNAKNGHIGSLARNEGEVIGVFASVFVPESRPIVAYQSTARVHELRQLEHRLRSLDAPAWPADVFTDAPIDKKMATAGKEIFKEKCASCHTRLNRFPVSLFRSFTSVLIPIEDTSIQGVHTDPTAAALIRHNRAPTGILRGVKKIGSLTQTYGDTESVAILTEDTIARVLLGGVLLPPYDPSKGRVQLGGTIVSEYANADELMPTQKEKDDNIDKGLVYRARPLNGIWATAPYLHNGSVPTLYDLLLPEDQRPKSFDVGRREYDPKRVGYVTGKKGDTFTFNTRLKGNSNKGHDYGASHMKEEERWALVEYLMTL